ncbi:hypothetical protein J8281_06660 [Aquimarina sp. U1-2]|uniref:hypothetical protein n=1 Tax=Aquimarina sp. U1-2 TaxID=2823141 RepID=UPI001AECBA06|nr:hypothetical protein [Aquimarina sp. U1-2]MBP2831865.1 hypothetical protein [Aquimarina sp. U1-2]
MTKIVDITGLDRNVIFLRLTTLWALNEVVLGGIIHLFKLPFSGLLLAGFASIVIALIAKTSSKPQKDIFKALLIVLALKGLVSPQSPLPAYFAVALQGFMGIFLFFFLKNFKIAAFLLSVLALLTSAVQKIFVLTILFGNTIWEALDGFYDFVLLQLGFTTASNNFSYWLVGMYVLVHLVFGLVYGLISAHLPAKLRAIRHSDVPMVKQETILGNRAKKRKAWYKRPLIMVLLIAVGLITFVLMYESGDKIVERSVGLAVRIFVVFLIWFYIIAPFLMSKIKRWSAKGTSRFQNEINEALVLLPYFSAYAKTAFHETKEMKGFSRLNEIVVRTVGYALFHKNG